MNGQTSLVEISNTERKIADRVDNGVTNGLALSSSTGGLGFANAGEAMEFAKLMALSQVAVPKHLRGNPGACLAVVIQSVEWRMSPYAVANKSYSVNDRLAYESQLVQAVILQRAPIKGRFRFSFTGEGAKRRCRVEVTTKDGDVVEYTTPEIEKIPVKNSPLWKGDPDQQMTYYAGRALCRRHFPDVLLGVYTPEEIETDPRDPAKARDVTPRGAAPKSLTSALDQLSEDASEQIADETTRAGPDANDTASAHADGRACALSGGSRTDCPADLAPDERAAWLAGFDEAEAEVDALA